MMMKKNIIFLCLIFTLLSVTACGKKEPIDKSKVYDIYRLNKDETKISSDIYEAENIDTDALIDELLEQLALAPEDLDYKAPITGKFKLLNYSLEEKQLILSFDEHYKEQPTTTEVLVRAAIVRTMTQIKDIDYVSFQIKNNPLSDKAGNVIGIMSADMFINNTGKEFNSYEKVTLRLYFANKEGDKLIETNRKLVYSTNVSMEKLVVEQLIGGPSEKVKEKVFPTINPNTKIISVTVKDGTCYVNLNETFLNQNLKVTSDVTIYSLTNSLVELPNVNKVQIAVNGDMNVMYRENISLASPFERNLDIITLLEE